MLPFRGEVDLSCRRRGRKARISFRGGAFAFLVIVRLIAVVAFRQGWCVVRLLGRRRGLSRLSLAAPEICASEGIFAVLNLKAESSVGPAE